MSEQTDENKYASALRHGDGAGHPMPRGIGRSIRRDVQVPATVLICETSGGTQFRHGWRETPSAYACAQNAALPQPALAAAFGSEPGSDTTATS